MSPSYRHATITAAVAAVLALAACGGPSAPDPSVAQTQSSTESAADAAKAEAAAAAELEAREADLARRENELAMTQREQEVARRESELAAKEKSSAAKVAAKKAAAAPRPVAVAATPRPATPAPAAVPVVPVVVPAGTQLSIGLSSPVSTKTATIGDPVDARLASDVVIDGRRAVLAGAPVRGRVTEVVSGSRKIGGTPTLGMAFDGLELEDGSTVMISGRLVQQGKSDTGRDTAKILGGTAAGAVIGHQIDDDKGTVIGGILGGAAGALAARKTGGEIDVPAGTVMAFVVDQPFQVQPN